MTRRRALTLVELLVVAAIVGLTVAMLFPAVRSARPTAHRNVCLNNLKQITLALLSYEAEHGCLPPAYTVDADGNRLHSWRTLILPFMEQASLYQAIDLEKPWDDPANAKARQTVVSAYQCPSANHAEGLTTYLAVVGPDYAFSGSVGRNLSQVTDGPKQTVAIVDVAAEHAVHWMSPEDIGPDTILQYATPDHSKLQLSHPPEIILAGFLDGRPRSLPLAGSADDLQAMLTIAGGEKLSVD